VYWEDVAEGMELPPLVKHPTTRQLVQYAGASGDYYEIHYDQEYARGNGLEGVILIVRGRRDRPPAKAGARSRG